MMKHLYLLFILLVPVSGYSQKSIEYIEQYVEIINNISQDHYSEYPDDQSVIYFTFNTDSILVDSLLENAIRERVKDSRCVVRFPDENAPVYLLGSPILQKDGSIVFYVGLGYHNTKENVISVGGTMLYVYKKKRRKLKLVSTITEGI